MFDAYDQRAGGDAFWTAYIWRSINLHLAVIEV